MFYNDFLQTLRIPPVFVSHDFEENSIAHVSFILIKKSTKKNLYLIEKFPFNF